jgi:hypothetical protein
VGFLVVDSGEKPADDEAQADGAYGEADTDPGKQHVRDAEQP